MGSVHQHSHNAPLVVVGASAAGVAPVEAAREAAWYEEQQVELRAARVVQVVDTLGMTTHVSDGSTASYGALVLASC